MTVTSQGSEGRTQRGSCEDGGRDCSDAPISQGRSVTTGPTESQERGLESLPKASKKGPPLPTRRFQADSGSLRIDVC